MTYILSKTLVLESNKGQTNRLSKTVTNSAKNILPSFGGRILTFITEHAFLYAVRHEGRSYRFRWTTGQHQTHVDQEKNTKSQRLSYCNLHIILFLHIEMCSYVFNTGFRSNLSMEERLGRQLYNTSNQSYLFECS